jgi:hypothetical protein
MRLRFCSVLLSLATLCVVSMQAQAGVDRARLGVVLYRSHFQPNPGASPDSGSRDGWESFPISQEAGYDPTINPQTVGGESALVRQAVPTRDGPFQLGFIRRFHLVAGEGTWIRAKVRVPYAVGPTNVIISIFRGERKERHIVALMGGAWQQIICPISKSPAFITAVAIAAEFPRASQGRTERFLIEDVRFKALGIRRIDLVMPTPLWDPSRELAYFKRSLHPGENLAVVASVRGHVELHWELVSPEGKIAANGIGASVSYNFAISDPIGIWTLHFLSRDAQTSALLLVQPNEREGLLFDHPPAIPAALLASIRERRSLLEKTTHPESGMNIDSLDYHWLLPGLPSYFAITLQSSELAMLYAMEFRATGDTSVREHARKLLQSIARWRMWVHPWFPAHGYHSYYPVGIMTKYVVMAEQFLGSDLSSEDRSRLDHSLIELSIKPIYEEYVMEDRFQFNTSNWIGNTVGGALLAAMQSDDPDAAGYALGLYAKDRDHITAAYTSDGSYGEGVTYQRFDLEMTTLVAAMTKRLLKTSLDDLLMQPERYMRYASYGSNGLMDFGDSHVDLTPSNVFAYQAAQSGSKSLHDFYFKYRDESTAQILSRVLWESDINASQVSVSPVSPEPASILFDKRGIVVLRDSIDPDATVIAMRAGRNFNHNHADEGSLFYAHGGKLWLGEAGYADYYKDPSYQTYNIQAVGHNTLLLDGDAESQVIPGNAVFGSAPSFTHSLIGDQASLVQADLKAAYGDKVKRYTRSLFFATGGQLVVIDDIKTQLPQRFSQIWHPTQAATLSDLEQNAFHLSNGHTTLDIQAYATGKITTTAHQSPMPLVEYKKAETGIIERPIRIEISDLESRNHETIVTLIQPRDNSEGSRTEPIWTTHENISVLEMGDTGVRIGEDRQMPVNKGCKQILAWWRSGSLLVCGMQYKDRSYDAGLSANHPIDLELERGEGGEMNFEIHAFASTELTLHNLSPANRADYNCSSNCLKSSVHEIHIQAGYTKLHLRFVPKAQLVR